MSCYAAAMRDSGSLLLRVALGGAAAYVLAWLFDWHVLAVLAKPVPVLCLLGFLLPPRTRDARLVAGGLLLSALGDVLLETGSILFLPGLCAFLMAHVLYVAAFFGRTRTLHLRRLLPVALATSAIFLWLAPQLGAMRLPVLAYVVVISVMVWRAAAQLGEDTSGGLRPFLATLGAILFAVSDVMVAYTRFVDPEAALKLPLMLLYWLGQTAITGSSRRA